MALANHPYKDDTDSSTSSSENESFDSDESAPNSLGSASHQFQAISNHNAPEPISSESSESEEDERRVPRALIRARLCILEYMTLALAIWAEQRGEDFKLSEYRTSKKRDRGATSGSGSKYGHRYISQKDLQSPWAGLARSVQSLNLVFQKINVKPVQGLTTCLAVLRWLSDMILLPLRHDRSSSNSELSRHDFRSRIAFQRSWYQCYLSQSTEFSLDITSIEILNTTTCSLLHRFVRFALSQDRLLDLSNVDTPTSTTDHLDTLDVEDLLLAVGFDFQSVRNLDIFNNGLARLPKWVLDLYMLSKLDISDNPIEFLPFSIRKLPLKRLRTSNTLLDVDLPTLTYPLPSQIQSQLDKRQYRKSLSRNGVYSLMDYASKVIILDELPTGFLPPHLIDLTSRTYTCEICLRFRSGHCLDSPKFKFFKWIAEPSHIIRKTRTTGDITWTESVQKPDKWIKLSGKCCSKCADLVDLAG